MSCIIINVKDFGAIGNGIADDTKKIQAAIDSLHLTGGGTLCFPSGTYRTTAPLNAKSGIKLKGTGRRKAYPGSFSVSSTSLATIFADHTKRCAVRISNSEVDANSGLFFEDINFSTNGLAGYIENASERTGPVAAFGFECGTAKFQRDFTFERVGVHGFISAFDCYKIPLNNVPPGENTQMGVIKILNCAISRNGWIARCLNDTQWNGFTFLYNEAGQNGYDSGGGISIAASNASIEHNILEGQRDPIYVFDASKGLSIRGNYFEGNVGVSCIQLRGVRGPWVVGPNTYLSLDKIEHTVLLGTPCGIGHCIDPYWPELVYKTPLAVLGADGVTRDNTLNPSVDYPFARVDQVNGNSFNLLPLCSTIAMQPVTAHQRELNPVTGSPMPVQEYLTIGSSLISFSYSIPGQKGNWVVMCWLMKMQPDAHPTPEPYVAMYVNGTSGNGSRDFQLYQFGEYFLQGEWALVTCATKLQTTMTTLNIALYPHGLPPTPTGRSSRFLRPVVYVTDTPTKIIPYINNHTASSCANPPNAGNWYKGDRLNNSLNPSSGHSVFICTATGTPGTWVIN